MTLHDAIRRAAQAVQPVTRRWPATLSNSAGDITPGASARVSGSGGLVYCVMPDGSTVRAYNNRVPPTTGLRVWVGYEPLNPSLLRVLDFNSSYIDPSGGTGFGPHHVTHEYHNPLGGGDVVYSQARQLMPLRVSVVSGMVVKIEPSPAAVTGGWDLSTSATLDLSGDIPTTGSLYALLYLDAEGTFARRLGANVGAFGSLSYSDIPAASAGERALAAVALYLGQTAIQETLAKQDIVDLRFAGSGASGSDLGWFNVRDYGATGDGSTDDTTAISDAIDALTDAGGGVLYFPTGTYKTTGGLTLSVPTLVLGDGFASAYGRDARSQVNCTSATAVLFTCTAVRSDFQGLALKNTNAGTPSAGAGIRTNSSDMAQIVNFENVSVYGFYINYDIQVGDAWLMHNCNCMAAVLYGVSIQNTLEPDTGGWRIDACFINSDLRDSTAGVHIENCGSGRITNSNFNGAGWNGPPYYQFDNAIEVIADPGSTTLVIANNSIETVGANSIYVETSGATNHWDCLIITGNEFGCYETGNHAIQMVGDTLGNLTDVIIANNAFRGAPGTTEAAIDFVKVQGARISNNFVDGFAAGELSQSGCADIIVSSGGSGTVTEIDTDSTLTGGPITTTGTLSIPNSGVVADTYTAPTITIDPQGRITAATNGTGGLQILVSGAAPVDPLTNGADTDYLYG